ncbi:gamma-glutamylcyclotransferase family protein [uncultured Oscillibacter sp.]|uniref:gamma-glutamylcyclotransferase family protein n=1 Tax=uncultured Oscillibacter sp. TaxID=876091 RepID=UPI0026306689|nr:gamma-glutamylcyclotransferase family protein [uncultured Oscillibacter sp.]
MADGILYFAYGSNINLKQMACRCPDATVMGPVTLDGWELLFRRSGFATIAPKEGEKVTGLLWSITPECERALDCYEGYPRFYDKRMVTVRDSEGRSLSAMVYIMDERFREPKLPFESYYNGILEGYRQNGLPVAELKKAWDHAVREVHAETERINAGFADKGKRAKGGKRHER